jgi:tripartite-type tricarboxylate transporter receptor subunit TctC
MKQFILAVLLSVTSTAWASETISILSPYSANHSGTPAMYKIIDTANKSQSRYNFILEFKPGGEQIIAVRTLNENTNNRLAIIAPKFVEHTQSGKLKFDDYVPVHALGDACWAVIANVGNERQGVASLQGQAELVVGGVGFGNAAHLTSLQLAEKFGFKVRYVPFKANYDALVLMAGDNSINMVVDRVASYRQFRDRNPNIKLLGMSCLSRHPDEPKIKTLAEQGITAPFVFNITVAHKNMDAGRRAELGKILQDATRSIGRAEIQKISDMTPPVFDNVDINLYYNNSVGLVRTLLNKHKHHINQ